METGLFLVLGGIVLLATIAVGLLGRPKPAPGPKPPPPASRWSVFRLHPARLLAGGGPAVEALPEGPRLTARAPFTANRPRLDLVDAQGEARISIRKLWRPGRPAFRVDLDRRPLAVLRPAKGAKGLPGLSTPEGNLSFSGDLEKSGIELRRGGKLLASASKEIAASPGALGLEVLSVEDPLPVLALVTALTLVEVEGKKLKVEGEGRT